jgi:hypothetical protein
MNTSWLLPQRAREPIELSNVKKKELKPIIKTEKDYYAGVSHLFSDEESRAKMVRAIMKAKQIATEQAALKLANRPKFLDPYSLTATGQGSGPGPKRCTTCEATLMNGLKCSSKAKFGSYCGRHKIV